MRRGKWWLEETCEIAVERIEWMHSAKRRVEEEGWGGLRKSDFMSVDPAPPVAMMQSRGKDGKEARFSVEELGIRLMDIRLGLFERYRAMFALRIWHRARICRRPCLLWRLWRGGLEDGSALFSA